VHVSTPLEPFEYGNPPARALDFITQVFVQSDTTVACISGVPSARNLGEPNVSARVQLTEILDRLAGPRAILHANADPERGASELDYMAQIADAHPLSAWKIYPHAGSYLLDSDEIGGPFLERVRDLGVRVVAAHRGISDAGGYQTAGSPRDVVFAARTAPDISFLIYHSGWEPDGDENHPFDPDDPNPRGVDRLIKAVRDAGLATDGNVYAELGTTWANLMNDPDSAAHVLGKLLLHLGPNRVVWGTDSVFNGVPQGQIVAMRAFQIPEAMQAEHGYPALTDETRRQIFGLNAARVYGVDVEATRYAIDNDDVADLRAAYRYDPHAVGTPSRYDYTGPRTRRDFLELQTVDPHPPRRG
jgi:predicted TIM-barrel fold metal-dependent hydrolase